MFTIFKNLFPLAPGPFSCGEVNAEAGQIQSVNYPNNYPNNEECVWVITVPSGSIVSLVFETPFEVRSCNYMNRFFLTKLQLKYLIFFPD